MKVTLGFSPCPNDTFMFHALLHDAIPTEGLQYGTRIEDVETLNQMAFNGDLDITKLSYHAYLKLRDKYTLLRAGSALGFGCGPLVIARQPLTEDQLLNGRIAVPGENTTAHMLFRLRYPDAMDKQFVMFSDIEPMVASGEVDAGVIIHENRFTYEQRGLVKITDLGEYWEQETNSPIPLGAIVARRDLGQEVIEKVQSQISASVQYAFDHPDASAEYVKQYAAEMDPEVMRRHIETYVNSYSVDFGDDGMRAIENLERRAREAGII